MFMLIQKQTRKEKFVDSLYHVIQNNLFLALFI